MALQVIQSKENPLDVVIEHVGNVVPLHIVAPHIREVKAALLGIKQEDKDTQAFAQAVSVIERFIYTR